jgi:hypothetical protein
MQTTCRGCGKKVFFAIDTENGKTQILDAVAPVYEISSSDEEVCVRRRDFYVSHFATCPQGNYFHRKAQEREP